MSHYGCLPLISLAKFPSLDYAKTSHLETMHPSSMIGKEHATTIITPLGLANLVETAAEAIVAGHEYRRSDFGSSSNDSHNDSTAALDHSAGGVMIILSIDWQISGILKSDISSWKRIIMNLGGNALKYTRSGFVHLYLGSQTAVSPSTSPARRHITLQVSDSGKGISRGYLKNDLFKPFAQEDQLSIGTGLGLSIVRQIVANLGGNIDVQSEVGYGTTVKVSVPVDDYPPVPQSDLEDSLITDMRMRCQGLKLCIVGFDYYPDIGEEPTGILSAHARCLLLLGPSISKIAADWFGMEVIAVSSLADATADVSIVLRSRWDSLEKPKDAQPLILLEDSPVEHASAFDGVFSLSRM